MTVAHSEAAVAIARIGVVVFSEALRIRRVASMPFRLGICMSIRIMRVFSFLSER
jgi:hypothetical protein